MEKKEEILMKYQNEDMKIKPLYLKNELDTIQEERK